MDLSSPEQSVAGRVHGGVLNPDGSRGQGRIFARRHPPLARFLRPLGLQRLLTLGEMLTRLGRYGDLVSKTRESLLSLSRLCGFYRQADKSTLTAEAPSSFDAHIGTTGRDISSLNDHAAFLSGKVAFLLDATLGLINVEQNAIIRIVSVAAVGFWPPTLVASIYGMNFEHVPELAWPSATPWPS